MFWTLAIAAQRGGIQHAHLGHILPLTSYMTPRQVTEPRFHPWNEHTQ